MKGVLPFILALLFITAAPTGAKADFCDNARRALKGYTLSQLEAMADSYHIDTATRRKIRRCLRGWPK